MGGSSASEYPLRPLNDIKGPRHRFDTNVFNSKPSNFRFLFL